MPWLENQDREARPEHRIALDAKNSFNRYLDREDQPTEIETMTAIGIPTPVAASMLVIDWLSTNWFEISKTEDMGDIKNEFPGFTVRTHIQLLPSLSGTNFGADLN